MRGLVFALSLSFTVAAVAPAGAQAPSAQTPPAQTPPVQTPPGQTSSVQTPPVVPQGPSAGDAGAPGAAPAAEYILGAEDTIEVEVIGQPDRSRARIYTDGTVQLNLVGRMMAAGRTPRELALEIAAALKKGGFYENPVVNVEVSGYASRYVTVLGAVTNPGLVPINRSYRLSEILARVGGVRGDAAEYLIVRPEKGPEKRYYIDKLAAGDASQDVLVTPGDKIFSPLAEIFYISGQVKSPGPYAFRTDMTIGQAIARGGGLTDSGNGKKVKVTRAGKTIKLDANAKVEPGDVLTVGERLF